MFNLPGHGRSSLTNPPLSLPSRRSSVYAPLQTGSQKSTITSWTEEMAIHRESVADAEGV
jgi:hypothetical protein